MAEIKTLRHCHNSETDRDTILVGKTARPTQGSGHPTVVLVGAEPATAISECPFPHLHCSSNGISLVGLL